MRARLRAAAYERYLELGAYVARGSIRTARRYARYRSRVPIAEKTVLFEAYHGARMSCNPYAIFKAMLDDPDFADYRFVWTLNPQDDPGNRILAEHKGRRNVEICKRHSRAYLRHLATAKYLVNNKTFHHFFVKRPEQVHISTWHGTTLKTLGKHQYGRMGQYHNVTRNYLQVDYLVMPNRFTADVMLDSCDVRSLFPGVVVDAGQPRSDLTVNTDPAQMKRYLADLLGIDPSKKIVLYAPTWRGEVGDSLDISDVILENIVGLQAGLPEGHEILLKVHDKTYAYARQHPALSELANVPDWFETNELLAGVDILITDYSSIFFDFAILRRPIIHFVFDRAEYERTRGLYFDMETEMAGPLCYTAEEVNAAIANIDAVTAEYRDRYERLIERYSYNEDGSASRRVLDIIFRGKQLEYAYRVEDTDKTRVLAYAGSLGPETFGIQQALSALDFGALDVSLLLNGAPRGRDEYYLSKLHPEIKVFYRTNTRPRRLVNRGLAMAEPGSRYLAPEAAAAWREEFLGTVAFDVAVDFSGRRSVWQQIFAHTPFTKKVVFLPLPFNADGSVSSPEFMATHFDELVCTTREAYDHYRETLSAECVDKLVLAPLPVRVQDVVASLSDDAAHLIAGIDYVAECAAAGLNPYCEPGDLLYEFRAGGLAPVHLAAHPGLAAPIGELSGALAREAAALEPAGEFEARQQAFGGLVRLDAGRTMPREASSA